MFSNIQATTNGKPLEFSKILYTSTLLYEKQLTPEYRVVFQPKQQSYPELIPAYLFKILDFFKEGRSVFELLGTYQTQYGFSFLSSSLDYLIQRGYITAEHSLEHPFMIKANKGKTRKTLKLILQLEKTPQAADQSHIKKLNALNKLIDQIDQQLAEKVFTRISLHILNPEQEALDKFGLLQKLTQRLYLLSKQYNIPLMTNLLTHMDTIQDHTVEILAALKTHLKLDFRSGPLKPSTSKAAELEQIFAASNTLKFNGFNLTLVKPLHQDSAEEVFSFVNTILNYGIKTEIRPYLSGKQATTDYNPILQKFDHLFEHLLKEDPGYVPMRDLSISGLHFTSPEAPNSSEQFYINLDSLGNLLVKHHYHPESIGEYPQLKTSILKNMEPIDEISDINATGSCSFLSICNRHCITAPPTEFRDLQSASNSCQFQYHLIPKFIDFTGAISLKKLSYTDSHFNSFSSDN